MRPQNICLKSTLRQPLRSFLLIILIGLMTFGFITKAVQFILIQRETEVLGSYYRSIGILENIEDPESGDISAGIELIQSSPYFAYGDQREIVSGVMSEVYNKNYKISNSSIYTEIFAEEMWPNVSVTDIWFVGRLVAKEDIQTLSDETNPDGYRLEFQVDTVLAAFPEYAVEGGSVQLFFIFKDHESSIQYIDEMVVSERYFIRGWEDAEAEVDVSWDIILLSAYLEIKPLDDEQLWYIQLEEEESINFNDPELAPLKNEIDVLNENLHTLGIIATSDMSAMPLVQEASHRYILSEGRWLNHQDDLDGNKVIVVPEDFALKRGLQLGDELQITFRPLTDTYLGLIRDGIDSENWRTYPTYQDTYTIVGLYTITSGSGYYSFIPTNSLPAGFTSVTQDQFNELNDYSFVIDSSRHESEFIQEYKSLLQELGISLTFLENNGAAYWDSVDPILRSLSANLLVFGLLMAVAFILAVFLYINQRKKDYAILRALGVPAKRANAQLILPLLLMGGLGIIAGGLTAWNYALDQARDTLSTIPAPSGVIFSEDLNPIYLIVFYAALFLFLVLFSRLGLFLLAKKSILDLLQGNTSQRKEKQKKLNTHTQSQSLRSSSTSEITIFKSGHLQVGTDAYVVDTVQKKTNSSSLGRYVLHQVLRSRAKSLLTFAIALGFVFAVGWIRQTMERSRLEVNRLYDTTIVEADILSVDGSEEGVGFIYRQTINDVLDSGFVNSSVLAASSAWYEIQKLDSDERFTGTYAVYAYDSPEAFYSGLEYPNSLVFAQGWDMDLFTETRTLQEIQDQGVPAIFPTSLIEQLQIDIGEQVKITTNSSTYTCVVVGQYSGWLVSSDNSIKTTWISSAGHYILLPLSTLESMEGSQTKFTLAHFYLDPEKNRDLPQLQSYMEEVMALYGGGVRFVIWDEELTVVIDQLEKNLSLLSVLYPTVLVVSVLAGAGLCFLLILQSAREAAILRILGITKAATRLTLTSEALVLSIIGVVIGLGISCLLWMASGLISVGSLLTGAGLYLAGVLIGSVTGAILVTNKMPLSLLQVKE